METLCRKCMQKVELESIPGTHRIVEETNDLGHKTLRSTCDYRRLDLCFYHRKIEEGLISKPSIVSRRDNMLDGRKVT